MTRLTDLPRDVLRQYCPKSHQNMLSFALRLCDYTGLVSLVNPKRRDVEWANNISCSVVLYSCSFTGFDPHSIVRLTLIDPHEPLSALAALVRLTHLTIAFSTTCSNTPQECTLSETCPHSIEKISLMGVPVVIVDELPDTCRSLSLTRCKEVRLEAGAGSLKELRLDDVSTTKLSTLKAKYLQELIALSTSTRASPASAAPSSRMPWVGSVRLGFPSPKLVISPHCLVNVDHEQAGLQEQGGVSARRWESYLVSFPELICDCPHLHPRSHLISSPTTRTAPVDQHACRSHACPAALTIQPAASVCPTRRSSRATITASRSQPPAVAEAHARGVLDAVVCSTLSAALKDTRPRPSAQPRLHRPQNSRSHQSVWARGPPQPPLRINRSSCTLQASR